jgi:SAM-dependent methyltransferase
MGKKPRNPWTKVYEFKENKDDVVIKYDSTKVDKNATVKQLDMTKPWWVYSEQSEEARSAVVELTDTDYKTEVVNGHNVLVYRDEPIGDFGDSLFFNIPRVMNPYLFDYYGWAHMFQYMNVIKYAKKYRPVVLDVGSGDAQVGQFLYRNRVDPRYIGIDISMKEIKRALEQSWGRKKPLFLQRDIREPFPFGDNTIDMVVLMESIEHVHKEEGIALLKEANRVMANDGVTIIATPNITNVKNKANWKEVGHLYEWDYHDLRAEIEKIFVIEKAFGTMIPRINNLKKEVKKRMEDNWLFDSIVEYFPSSFARLVCGLTFPEMAEDVTFICRKK